MASQACGGADADIFIDGTLYDFKTTKNTNYRWQDVAQIFGYYFLSTIATQLNDHESSLYDYDIKRLVFYKARFGEVEYIDISEMDGMAMEEARDRVYDILKPRLHYLQYKKEL